MDTSGELLGIIVRIQGYMISKVFITHEKKLELLLLTAVTHSLLTHVHTGVTNTSHVMPTMQGLVVIVMS